MPGPTIITMTIPLKHPLVEKDIVAVERRPKSFGHLESFPWTRGPLAPTSSSQSQWVPDGMKVDVKGRLFVSEPTGIWVWNGKGVHIGTVQMPKGMANLTWGGPDNSKLYITASDSVYILQTKTRGILGYTK